MPRLVAARLGLALAALLMFGIGIRNDENALRVAGIGLLAAALVLRFAGPRLPRR